MRFEENRSTQTLKLYAISDLHVGAGANLEGLRDLAYHPEDWLILAGDVGETTAQLRSVLALCVERFREVVWVPGNHELWTSRGESARGQAKYEELVAVCRSFGVHTPEDPYPVFQGTSGRYRIAPLFILYDYSFRPPDVPRKKVVEWAMEQGVLCADEVFLWSEPFPSREDWCWSRVRYSEARLEDACRHDDLVLVNHFPLMRDLVWIPSIPRFAPWCGTTMTADWHRRFRAKVVVSGHLHVRRTDWLDGVRFEEVSLGNPRQWRQELGVNHYLREILPGPVDAAEGPGSAR